ncbi:MAG: GNAT family N-acetyltransferase [Eubacteriales bacterium]|nr:GNAT family N-acetyltransferase [Eubacteriales bacterium]
MELQVFETESERLRFRRLRADDFALVAPILQDEQTMYAWEHAFSYDEVIDWIADMLRRYREDGCGCWAALDKVSGELAALAGVILEAPEEGEAPCPALLCIVARERWAQGYGAECAKAALAYAFDRLEAERVIALIRPENEPSLRVAAACGMRPVGQMVKHYQGKELPHLICEAVRPQA